MTQWKEAARRLDTYLFLVLILILLGVGAILAFNTNPAAVLVMAQWFDPVFFQYNLALAMIGILIVPSVTFVYVGSMRGEKERRLFRELTEAEQQTLGPQIKDILARNIRFRGYFGSIVVMVVVLALGTFIILLLKPALEPKGPEGGVDYSRGANFLLLGPFVELYETEPKKTKLYHHLIVALTAFQFGFLGAYVYFIGHLVRSYFTLDLSPNTFIDSAIRMVTGSILALVLSFILPTLPFFETAEYDDLFLRSLPVVAFFIGFFPSRGLHLMQKFGTRVTGIAGAKYNAQSLSELAGMSFASEVRLNREGFDNLENLSHADALGLALRTGFGYRQLEHWVGQAWLRVHLGEDYAAFEKGTGITSREELKHYIARGGAGAVAELTNSLSPPLPEKVNAVCVLLRNS